MNSYKQHTYVASIQIQSQNMLRPPNLPQAPSKSTSGQAISSPVECHEVHMKKLCSCPVSIRPLLSFFALAALGLCCCVRAFSGCGVWALERGLSSCGMWAVLLRSVWDLPGPGIDPVTLHWQAEPQPLGHHVSPAAFFLCCQLTTFLGFL